MLSKSNVCKRVFFHSILTGTGVCAAGSMLINPITVLPSIALIVGGNFLYKSLEDWTDIQN